MQFFLLQPDGLLFGTKWAYAEKAGEPTYANGPVCPVCGDPVGGKIWLPPQEIRISSSKPAKWGDFLWGSFFPIMISGRARQLYEAEGLTGITSFEPPAEVVRVGKRPSGDIPPELPDYYLVRIIWNGANLDDVASEAVRYERDCSYHKGGVRQLRGVYFEEASWQGDDIFIARGLAGVVVISERMKDLIVENDLTNVTIIPAEEYAYDEYRAGLWYRLGES